MIDNDNVAFLTFMAVFGLVLGLEMLVYAFLDRKEQQHRRKSNVARL